MAGLSSIRLDNAMEDNNNYNHGNVGVYDRNCETHSGNMDPKESSSHYTIQGVLHFLQTEWTRLEMQRSHWEVERAEMQARIAFLQGERRGQENLKQDLVRRIKMLEYGLKQERVKFHQYKASHAAENSSQAISKPSQESSQRSQNSKGELDGSKILNPAAKLAQCTEQTLESNAKWRESRLRLKRILQEIGYTDTVLNMREARVRNLLFSAAGWPGSSPDSSHPDVDTKTRRRLPNQNLQTSDKSDADDDKYESQDEQAKAALDEIEDAVRSVQDMADSSGEYRFDLHGSSEESTEPDTTGHLMDPMDTAWVSRFRRSGVPGSNEAGKRKSQGLSKYDNIKNISANTALSTFLSGLAEGGSPNQMKRVGRKIGTDVELLDFINTLEKMDDDSTFSNSQELSSSTAPFNVPKSLAPHGSSLPGSTWQSDFPDVQPDQAGSGKERLIDHLDMGKEPSSNGALVLGDLASLTVTNDADMATNGDLCDSSMPSRTNHDNNGMQSGSVGGTMSGDNAGSSASTGYAFGAPVPGRRMWTPKYTLRGHFDSIRTAAFHPTERAIYTAGEDGCVMLWNLSKTGAQSSSLGAQGRSNTLAPGGLDELSPSHVYCGHDGPVLSMTTPNPALAATMSTALYTGGLDGSVRAWRLPAVSGNFGAIDLYAPHEMEALKGPVLQSSTSSAAVWSVALHPSSPILLAAHADGVINFWSTVESTDNSGPSAPILSVQLDKLIDQSAVGDQPPIGRPTCLHYLINRPDSFTASQCVVGTSTGWLILVDVETGQLINQIAPAPPLPNNIPDDQTPLSATPFNANDQSMPEGWTSRALNALGSHQTLSLVIGAHEDRCVRFYDISRMSDRNSTTACVDTMVVHLDAVTSLAVDPHGLYMVTGSHDASVRIWDVETKSCVQEMTSHCMKNDESVHAVTLHPQLPLAASAGADGVCKVYVTAN